MPPQKKLIVGEKVVKAGDVLGFSGRGFASAAINLATYGIPGFGCSHVAIFGVTDDKRLLVFESTSLSSIPCAIRGSVFSGTQAHELDAMLQDYDGKVYHYPLYRPLYIAENERLTQFLMETLGTSYDMTGAFRTAGVGLSWVESLLRPQDLTQIFCSELVAAALTYVGIFPTTNVSRWNPNRLVRTLHKHGLVGRAERLK